MFVEELKNNLNLALINKKEKGAYKAERIISTAQGSQIKTTEGKTVLNINAKSIIDISKLSKGLYVIKFNGSEFTETRNFVVE